MRGRHHKIGTLKVSVWHQQFQEYYASLGLEAELRRANESTQDADKLAFAKFYPVEPAWAEPLRIIAGHLGSHATSDDALAAAIGHSSGRRCPLTLYSPQTSP